jgi:hypothetical protein
LPFYQPSELSRVLFLAENWQQVGGARRGNRVELFIVITAELLVEQH